MRETRADWPTQGLASIADMSGTPFSGAGETTGM